MTLDEAYSLLGLEDSLGWRSQPPDAPEDRGIGSTTHTLVELYLDMAVAHENAARRGAHSTRFLLFVPSRTMGIHARNYLARVHETLRCSVDPDRLTLQTTDQASLERLRGNVWYSWAIFCDHSVKDEVIPWPYNRIRALHEEEDDCWAAKDRDGVLLMHLTENGKTDFLKRTTCPISVVPSWLDAPACYPAWSHPFLQVRLVEPFKI